MRLALALAILAAPGAALAHPMGNFSVNRHMAVTFERDRVRVDWMLDFAEIPAAAELREIDRDRDGSPSDPEKEAWLDARAPEWARGIALSVDGEAKRLHVGFRLVETPPGEGGAPTLRVVLEMASAARIDRSVRVEIADDGTAGRRGWREIVPVAGPGIRIVRSSVPMSGSVAGSYGSGAVPDHRRATFEVAPGDGQAALGAERSGRPSRADAGQDDDGELARFLRGGSPSTSMLLVALGTALFFGAAHALSPGHGKTLVGAYLVGSRGKPRHAVTLGVIVTFTHTVSVFLLGLIALYASRYVLPERLFPWLGFTSGMIIVAIGLGQLPGRVRRMKGKGAAHPADAGRHDDPREGFVKIAPPAGGDAHVHVHRLADGREVEHDHAHTHDHDGHGHGHGHGHGDHRHVPEWAPDASVAVKMRELVALGVSGGIVPCPSAMVVLLTAISLQRIGFGLLLIVAFSVGLAATLTSIGLIFVLARDFLERIPASGRISRVVPVVSTCLIIVIGAGIAWRAIATGEV